MVYGDSHDGCVGEPCPELTYEVILCAPSTDQREPNPVLHSTNITRTILRHWEGLERKMHSRFWPHDSHRMHLNISARPADPKYTSTDRPDDIPVTLSARQHCPNP